MLAVGWESGWESPSLSTQTCIELSCFGQRDLKTDNVLITIFSVAKVADFGESRQIKLDEHMTVVGTSDFIAPEITRGEKYDEKVDVYSFSIM